jgi:hypothetical protein
MHAQLADRDDDEGDADSENDEGPVAGRGGGKKNMGAMLNVHGSHVKIFDSGLPVVTPLLSDAHEPRPPSPDFCAPRHRGGWFGISRLDFDVDPLSLLPQELPGLQGTRLLREQKRDLLLIAVQADDPALVEVTAEALAEHLASKPELCASVRSKSLLQSDPAIIAEVVAYLWLNAPPQEVAKLTASLDACITLRPC